MLFHSSFFLFVFLPLALLGFFAAGQWFGRSAALLWLTLASLFFYGNWNPVYLWLLGASMLCNYPLGSALARKRAGRPLLFLGIGANLVLLGYFKYWNFFLATSNAVVGTEWSVATIVLPLGISFFTFEQIAWLVESYQGKLERANIVHYCAFITNFPKLIAGPIIRPHELLPQFGDAKLGRVQAENISVGLTIFLIGLFKKVVLADTVSVLVGPVFHASALGLPVPFFEAWGALLAYALQIYFDFSGYTDMAIGIGRMFGFSLPLNFNAPYKSLSIIDFWRRWHMSLSRFIRDYVYIPLGGSRRGVVRRWFNLFITMVLCGLWHGAGWTFIVWGALHGIFLMLNHGWRATQKTFSHPIKSTIVTRTVAWVATFTSVLFAWVFFRSENMHAALRFIGSLLGSSGISLPGFLKPYLSFIPAVSFDLQEHLILLPSAWLTGAEWLLALLFIALALPTTQQFMRNTRPAYDSENEKASLFTWRPNALYAFGLAILTAVTIIFLMLSEQSEFLYFQF